MNTLFGTLSRNLFPFYLICQPALDLLHGADSSIELRRPTAPTALVAGESGQNQACYWVAAATGDIRQGGKITDLSPAVSVTNLPLRLDVNNYATISISPVDGASLYYVYKTTPLPKPDNVNVVVANKGSGNYYYWIVVCNGWRQSDLYGPYLAENCSDPAGNVIEWSPVPNASWYHLYRTNTPEKPLGRTYCVVGLQLGMNKDVKGPYGSSMTATRMIDRGGLAYGVAGFTATPINEAPIGEGLFLLATTKETSLQDIGQPLLKCVPPTSNQTISKTLAVPGEGLYDLVNPGGYFHLKTKVNLPHLLRPSFNAHSSPFLLENVVEAGPHSEYFNTPGTPGWKSTVFNIETHQTLYTTSQATMLGGYQTNYGSGDTMYYNAATEVFGANRDDGDEGAKSMRITMKRTLQEHTDTLAEPAERGATKLPLKAGDFGAGGTGRLVVNLSQQYQEGRIRRVGNTDVHGKGTRWNSTLAGQYISFDVDTVKGHRMWYQITEVKGTDALTIWARTEWSQACNIGYSRFIHDPAEIDHPSPANVNSLQNNYLPPEHVDAAKNGGYLICPGTYMSNPWKEGKTWNVEPLREAWKEGDQVQIAAGPQAYVTLGTFGIDGDYTPQDDVGGLSIRNTGNRMANRSGITIGNTGDPGFAEGLQVGLSKTGASDGVVIAASTTYDAKGLPTGNSGVRRGAIVVPDNLPAIVGEHDWLYPHIRWSLSSDGTRKALEFATKAGQLVAGFEQDRIILPGIIQGSPRTRGKALFSGNGRDKTFQLKFNTAYTTEPFITMSTNQFARSRVASVTKDALTIEFETPPETGNNNISIWWMAQE